jgi:hypothetical protein
VRKLAGADGAECMAEVVAEGLVTVMVRGPVWISMMRWQCAVRTNFPIGQSVDRG